MSLLAVGQQTGKRGKASFARLLSLAKSLQVCYDMAAEQALSLRSGRFASPGQA